MILSKYKKARVRWIADRKAKFRGGFWFTLIMWAVFFVASQLLKPKPDLENAKPSGLGDFRFPTATEGRAIPKIYGTVRIDGPNVTWWGDLVQDAITEEVKVSLFSSETLTKGFKYHLGVMWSLCEGPLTGPHDGLLGFWIGDDQAFSGTVTAGSTMTVNEPELFGGNDLGNGGFIGTFTLHGGATDQAVSTYLAQFQKEPAVTGDTPAYRGTC